ncbi:MAG TPA: glycosyltransferase [Capillimicrobium sp.]|jgi:MGT family glycosyltransferase
MTTYLLTLWDGGGAVPPQLSVARALVARGHTVRALCDAALVEEARGAGVDARPWTRAPQRVSADPRDTHLADWEIRNPIKLMAMIRDRLVFGPAGDYAADVLAEHARAPFDVLLTSDALPGPALAAEALGLPFAVMVNQPYPLPLPDGFPPMGTGLGLPRGPVSRARNELVGKLAVAAWAKGLPDLNAARAGLGLAPADGPFAHLHRADRVLVLTSAAFDLGGARLPANTLYAGPRLDDPTWAPADAPLPPGDDPLVLVSLSSTYMRQGDLLGRIAQALGTLPVRGLVTTGPALDPGSVPAPANVTVVRTASHAAALRQARAVVTHGGHGTVVKALAAGVPVVVLPMGRDQPDNATRVVAASAGARLRKSASAPRIAGAVRRALEDPALAAGARRMAAAIAEDTARDRAADELEALGYDARVMTAAQTAVSASVASSTVARASRPPKQCSR